MPPAHATTRRARRLPRGGGFTLIEVLAVMVIIAVMAATAAPVLSSLGNTRGTMAAKHLLHDIAFAQQYAIATGTVTWVVFDTSAETWEILIEDPSNPGRTNAIAFVDPSTHRDHQQALDSGEFAEIEILTAAFDSDVEIGFDWLGAPLNAAETALGATGTVTLTGNHQVSVNIGTGHVAYTAP